jgi:hypothetical protein
VFTRTAGVWSQQAYVKASNTGAGDSFGSSVVLSGDTLVVGASGEASCATGINGNQGDNSCFGAGAVYVFTRTAGVLSQQTYVKASNTGSPSAAGNFGSSMALADNILAVGSYGQSLGSGAVYMFASISGLWSQQAFVKAPNADRLDFFGSSVALSGDTLAVGAPGEDSCATGINGNQGDNSCGPSENEAAPGAGAAYVYGGQ